MPYFKEKIDRKALVRFVKSRGEKGVTVPEVAGEFGVEENIADLFLCQMMGWGLVVRAGPPDAPTRRFIWAV